MTYGLDTTFLVEVDVLDHEGHQRAVRLRDRLLDDGHEFALTPQVLTEYVHIITDGSRFVSPASMRPAIARSRAWWNATEVVRVTATDEAVTLFHTWMEEHRLGRKRILDTMLAATYVSAGIKAIVSSNARDFGPFFPTVARP